MNSWRKAPLLGLLSCLLQWGLMWPGCALCAENENTSHVFATWEGFESDKCASIWLIKRFIDRDAVIKFYPKGDVIEEGIAFDTPEAEFRRRHNMSTYETILAHYKLDDPRLVRIGQIIHDLEVNVWEEKVFKESLVVLGAMNEIIKNSGGNEEVIAKSCRYFDSFYESLK